MGLYYRANRSSLLPVSCNLRFQTDQWTNTFCRLLVGYVIAYFSCFPYIIRQTRIRKADPDALAPETRLWWLLYTVPLLPLGLFGFAWTSLGPSRGIPWIAPMIFSSMVGIANFTIYMTTIDYMVI